MTFDPKALDGIKAEAKRLDVEWPALAAVAWVESNGRPLWDGLCPIRIEGHYFYKRLTGAARKQAVKEKLAHPKAGKVTNPKKMADRYAKLERMKAINANAALESCSWGLGQVMGAHWEKLGYPSVREMTKEAQTSVSGQVMLMGRYIEVFGLKDELQQKDWAGFALGYNGKNYAKYSYDTKMAKAYKKFVKDAGSEFTQSAAEDLLLERGDTGPEVRKLEAKLVQLGYLKGKPDSVFDGGTETAVMDFQRDARIQVDGRAGSETLPLLFSWKKSDVTKAGKTKLPQVVYVNQHATRNRPVTANLERLVAQAAHAVYGSSVQVQIYSGGQARKGTPGKRTGSVRHDDYGAGGRGMDAWIMDKNNTRLRGVELAKIGQYWLAKGYGGCGTEMKGGGIHLDEWTTPPPGGGMFWVYDHAKKQSWGKKVARMLLDGSRGVLP